MRANFNLCGGICLFGRRLPGGRHRSLILALAERSTATPPFRYSNQKPPPGPGRPTGAEGKNGWMA
jgi:hypothetical protein